MVLCVEYRFFTEMAVFPPIGGWSLKSLLNLLLVPSLVPEMASVTSTL